MNRYDLLVIGLCVHLAAIVKYLEEVDYIVSSSSPAQEPLWLAIEETQAALNRVDQFTKTELRIEESSEESSE